MPPVSPHVFSFLPYFLLFYIKSPRHTLYVSNFFQAPFTDVLRKILSLPLSGLPCDYGSKDSFSPLACGTVKIPLTISIIMLSGGGQ